MRKAWSAERCRLRTGKVLAQKAWHTSMRTVGMTRKSEKTANPYPACRSA
jgi:hypothetical protein